MPRIIGWTCTDPDSYQWRGDYDDGTYVYFDTVLVPDGYEVAFALIDLDLYDEQDKDSATFSFGYDRSEVDDTLLAECLFEDFELFNPGSWCDHFNTETKARQYIDFHMFAYTHDIAIMK